uniref:hypothetical protein n=2 Tax=Streptomyces TaxID=1883 RepID=UPI0036D43C74
MTTADMLPFIQRQHIETADIFSAKQHHLNVAPNNNSSPVPAFVKPTVPVLYRKPSLNWPPSQSRTEWRIRDGIPHPQRIARRHAVRARHVDHA